MIKDKKDMVLTPIRIERSLLHDLKERALFLNISLQKWIKQAIMDKILREDKAK